ncbi:MAG TPA: rhodanese-like domain-containing protein [Opitutaceae bacterium]
MKPRLMFVRILGIVAALVATSLSAADVKTLDPAEAAKRVAAGTAVLVDCREPAEWASGVVASATLLPLSDLRGDRKAWAPFLEANKGKEIIIYCRSGNRAGQAATLLAAEGKTTANAGGFPAWEAAGQPVRTPEAKAAP